jgi:hypothetical protein
LNEWLLDYENCHINIVGLMDSTLEDIDYTVFSYPILSYSIKIKANNGSSNEFVDSPDLGYNNLRKRNFCAVLAFVVSRFSDSVSGYIWQIVRNSDFCSNPDHGNMDDDDDDDDDDGYRQNCIFIFVLPEIRKDTPEEYYRYDILNAIQMENGRDIEIFILSFKTGSTSLYISKVEYVCPQQWIGSRPTIWEIQCPLPNPTCLRMKNGNHCGEQNRGRE